MSGQVLRDEVASIYGQLTTAVDEFGIRRPRTWNPVEQKRISDALRDAKPRRAAA